MAEITQTISLFSGDPPNSATQTQEGFDVSADALASKMAEWPSEYNTLADQTNTARDEIVAAHDAIVAMGWDQYAGAWADKVSPTIGTQGQVFSHNGRTWVLTTGVADVTLTEPSGNNTDWSDLSGAVSEVVTILSGASPELNPNNGTVHVWVLSAASTPTVSMWQGQSLTLFIDPTASSYPVTWDNVATADKWVGGGVPTLVSDNLNVIVLSKPQNTVYASYMGAIG